MYFKKFHEKWGLPLLVSLFCTLQLGAQCPQTKSASYGMLPIGLPTLIELKFNDFLVNPEEAALYTEVEVSQIEFLCDKLGVHEISISGIGPLGQSFACKEYAWVYDSVFTCGNIVYNPKAIGGRIVTELNEPMPDVTVGLQGMNTNYFQGSNDDGLFLFEDYANTDYEVKPMKLDGIRNGISTIDVLFLQKHILGIKKLGSPYKIIGADVNSSGNITAFDMVLLRQLILSTIDAFPNTPSWRFVDANFKFTDEDNPFLDDFPESFQLQGDNAQPALDNRFIAIKVGDFNHSVKLDPVFVGRASKANSSINLSSSANSFQKGELSEIELNFAEDQALEGFQFELNFDENKLTFVGIESTFEIEKNHYVEEDGILKFSWTNPMGVKINDAKTLLKIQFHAKEDGKFQQAVTLNNRSLNAEVYLDDEEILPLGLSYSSDSNEVFKVYHNYPNPFSNSTKIPFDLPNTSEVNLSVYDMNGQLVYNDSSQFEEGLNIFDVNQNLKVAGIYIYKLTSDFGVAKGKMNYLKR